ncbi:glycine betaine ABC transporter substrate-binding protein [Noviherbaspirillum sp.]|uniref:glycine betaine ABC transporter substrate-binding protein n=1 Tax=Noviherbaspirillum sp. TaxID=1926288 RepID=UPI002FE3A181
MREPFAHRWHRLIPGLCIGALWLAPLPAAAEDVLRIGSKRFTESYVLSEVIAQTAAPHARVEQRQGLGNTAIVFEALKTGSIDIYAEYLGTIDLEILRHPAPTSLEQINRELAPLGIGAAVRLGFNNTYSLAMRAGDNAAPRDISGLAGAPGLRLGLSHEFLGRADGWPGLASRYRLPHKPSGLDHGIAYEALAARQVDVIDIYSTDAKIRQYGLRVLADDAGYFPRYDALLLYRLDVERRFPAAWQALQQLEGRISEADMIAMNAAAELEGKSFADAAKSFLSPDAGTASPRNGLWRKLFDDSLWRLTREHILLVLVSVAAAAAIGIPLGVLAAYRPRLRQAVMALVGILQTVPALALFAMLIPLLGSIGTLPALIALFLYALLPIVRNTCAGLGQVPTGLRLAALALGLTHRDRLLHIDLPLALPVILAGLKTAAVMSVGTATIAAFIGAGGYGERIATGLALNDNDMLLAGAIPAAVLALLTQWLFERMEKRLLPGARID